MIRHVGHSTVGKVKMKKLILLTAILLLMAHFSEYTLMDKKVDLGDAAPAVGEALDGAGMIYISSDDRSLTVKVENNTGVVWQSGNMKQYRLEKKVEGEWRSLTQIGEFANTMELIIISDGESFEHRFDFSKRYGTLTDGTYRVVKSFWANYPPPADGEAFDLILEFEVKTK